jgi:putative membrane protein
MMGGYGSWGAMGWVGGAFMLLLLIGLVALGIVLARGLRPVEQRTPPDTATDVLRRRYAAGELSQQEFEQMRQTLTVPPAAPQGSTVP